MENNSKVDNIKKQLAQDLELTTTSQMLNDLKVKYLGKKGLITELTKDMGSLSSEERKEVGAISNEIRAYVTSCLTKLEESILASELEIRLKKDMLDPTLPSVNLQVGGIHPLTRITSEIEDLFVSMGYSVVSGPEVEQDLYNFQLLNLPKNHPARDAQDTFYITEEFLLRSQTSPVQARTMLANKEHTPLRIICPGKVYRRDDDDATHSHQFNQVEGLVVGENISLADLKGTLEVFAKKMFGEDRSVRFRPSYFPFTEPSYEVDVSCFKCGGSGCNICKGTGWIEVLGSGMVHPNVLNACGYDATKYTGFAFGVGIERVAMLRYGVSDIRDFYTNDLRFLNNYNRVEGDK
ncbi:MAG: phenylalanine--tRNA ligase subunit alpha [Bacilli bacterium]